MGNRNHRKDSEEEKMLKSKSRILAALSGEKFLTWDDLRCQTEISENKLGEILSELMPRTIGFHGEFEGRVYYLRPHHS